MADLYRKSALERISNPEQLDKVLKVTSPMSWLALGAITIVILITIIWSFIGSIPETVTVKGVICASTVGSNSVFTQETGTVVSFRVKAGDEVHLGDPIMTYRNAANDVKVVYSDQVGTVSKLVAEKDDEFDSGKDVIRVIPVSKDSQIAVCYVPLSDAKKLERGMRVNITLDALDSTSYGYMVARIINIDSYATPDDGMYSVLGNNNSLQASFNKDGAVVAVACELVPADDTVSGYYWSNARGASVSVSNGSMLSAKIITDEVAPITKLFSKLDDIWGG